MTRSDDAHRLEPPSPETGEAPAAPSDGGTSQLLQRLSDHGPKSSRYKLEGEVARGGMGAILKVWDEDLRRTLAMKVILGGGDSRSDGGASAVDERQLARFLEEAQVTGQLDHPGIVPVHELGLDSDGHVFFTMKLVKGRDLKHIFDLVFQESEGWNETRALSVMLKVCEAMAYAHTKGVIHRDLKPANVMVGNFGEVYVMDWGLARVLGRKDNHDIRLAPEFTASLRSVRTERREKREEALDSPIVTMDGDVMGTPAYMPPEQARGEIEKLSPRSDVYAIGAILYHLLTRQMPYVAPGARVSNRTVLAMVLRGPPERVSELRRETPAELIAICEKAMSREAQDRYKDTLELAEDLRAYLEHRVVTAYETGPVAEIRKWIGRNRALATASAAALLMLVVGLAATSILYVEADRNAEIAQRNETTATQLANDVLSLSAIQDLAGLVSRARELWPPDPGDLREYEEWLEDARVLVEGRAADPAKGWKASPGLAGFRAKLAELETRALPHTAKVHERAAQPRTSELDAMREDQWWHAQLSKLVADLDAFQDEQTGLYGSGSNPDHLWGMERRFEFARTIEERSRTGTDARARWEVAIASIADPSQCPAYGGLALSPQAWLLPIGRDVDSGLYEFAHLVSGEPGRPGPDGKLALTEETGIVLVLIPGGRFTMGAQSTDASEPNYDPLAKPDESPVREIELAPYFISKFEMTQSQWLRLAGTNPSDYGPHRYESKMNASGQPANLLHPVERVSWDQCAHALGWAGLTLPTEAQWEYACRAGTTTAYWSGDEVGTLQGAANLSDAYGKSHGNEHYPSWEAALDDGQTVHAPVGMYRPNPFGLFDTHGNVWEWCRDAYWPYSNPVREGDGERQSSDPRLISNSRVFRGGSFAGVAEFARSAIRRRDATSRQANGIGVRPARPVDP